MDNGIIFPFHVDCDWDNWDEFAYGSDGHCVSYPESVCEISECDFVEFPSGSGEFVPVDHYLEVLLDDCDRKEVRDVN